MAYMCRYSSKECDACGNCEPDQEPCPECGSVEYEEKYYQHEQWIGCSDCVKKEVVL